MKKTAAFISGWSLIVFWVLFSVSLTAFSGRFYTDLYQTLDLASKEDIAFEDLEAGITTMTDYVQGKRDDLEVTVTWKGKTGPAFNEKETAHMVDVRNLWLNARTVMWISGLLFVCITCFLLFCCRKRGLWFLAKGYLQALACFAVLLVFFGFWAWTDFTNFWTSFHHLFFSNSLWLLDPATDFMIVICPEEMFSTMILRIVLTAVLPMALMALLSWFVLRKAPIGFDHQKGRETAC